MTRGGVISADEAASLRAMKEMSFEQKVRQYVEYEKSKELKWFVCKGREAFTEQEREGKFVGRRHLEAIINGSTKHFYPFYNGLFGLILKYIPSFRLNFDLYGATLKVNRNFS